MKKRLLPVLISLFLVFSLCGCSSGGITGVWLFEDPAYESLYGIDPVQMYMQLNEDGTIIMISVSKSDYYDTTSYEYIKGTYVEKEDGVLTCALNDCYMYLDSSGYGWSSMGGLGTEEISYVLDGNKLTVGDEMEFKRTNSLPSLPDQDELNQMLSNS